MSGVLVLCLGNAIRQDDAVALRVADALDAAPAPGTTVRRSAASGLYLLDEMEGFDRVVVVDAVRTRAHPPGTVHSLPLEALHAPAGPSPHTIGLPSALDVARRAGAQVPSRVWIVAVEVFAMDEVGEGLSPEVEAALPAAIAAVRAAAAKLSDPFTGGFAREASASRRETGDSTAARPDPTTRAPSTRGP